MRTCGGTPEKIEQEEDAMQIASREAFAQEMRAHLHELCQPLTALQCRLEMGIIHGGQPELLRETVQDSLIETSRLFAAIAAMRERLLSEDGQ
jgi:signal transduction histidine kinase